MVFNKKLIDRARQIANLLNKGVAKKNMSGEKCCVSESIPTKIRPILRHKDNVVDFESSKFYVTTPIYYVNAKPHLGHLYTTLLADISARWNKLKGKQVYFLTGLDEHGQKVAAAAESAGMTPQAFVDSMVSKFKDVWALYGFDYSKFIRTSDPEHKKAVTKLVELLLKKDQIYKSEYTGFYCQPCETFINPQEVKESEKDGQVLCSSCGRETKQISEESYFFRLSNYQDRLLEFYAQNPNWIEPKERLNEVLSFVKSGLKDLSFSRKSVSWGIPFPGDSSHTVYVWGDALTNYISAIGYGQNQDEFDLFWPADLHILGKDILRFHAVYWPAILMAAGLELPRRELVHGYIIMDNKKMSKSIGNVVDPSSLADWYGVEQVRYYLARNIPTTQDSQFALSDLEECVRADLANNLGNLLSRTITLAKNNGVDFLEGIALSELNPEFADLLKTMSIELEDFRLNMDQGLFHIAISCIFKQLSNANVIFQKFQPWKLAKADSELFRQIIWTVLYVLKTCATLLWPVIPTKAEILLKTIGQEFCLNKNLVDQNIKLFEKISFELSDLQEPLFGRPVEHSKVDVQPAKQVSVVEEIKLSQSHEAELIDISDLIKVKMVVGKIVEAEALSGSDKILKLKVDLGDFGLRQVLSGIAKHYQPINLINKSVIFVVNLKPRKILGLESQAMALCAVTKSGELELVVPEKGSVPGTQIS